MRIPDHKVTEIFNATDLAEVIQDFVKLKKKGSNFIGLSPFQDEKTPSFHVNTSMKIYKCFSSGKGGNVISFLMESQGYGYRESLEYLAKKYSIDLTPSTEAEVKKAKAQEELQLQRKSMADYFISERGEEFEKFVTDREITPEAVDEFGLGWAPLKDPSKFRDRIIFPIHDGIGRVLGFGARTLGEVSGDNPKYKNSSEKDGFHKSKTLYNWHRARPHILRADEVILCEGYMDVISVYQRDVKNIVATCGTALNEPHLNLLRTATRNILILRDGDAAGQKATASDILLILEAGLNPIPVSLPTGMDPDDLIKLGQAQFLSHLAKNRKGWMEWLIEFFGYKKNMTPDSKAQLIRDLTEYLKKIKDELTQVTHIQELSDRMDLERKVIYRSLGKQPPAPSKKEKQRRYLERKWVDLELQLERLGVAMSPDFERSDLGYVKISYYDLKNKPHKVTKNQQEKDAARTTDKKDSINGVYIPQALRAEGPLNPLTEIPGLEIIKDGKTTRERLRELPLLLVRDEVTAHIFCELGLPAVGLSWPDAFTVKRGSERPHSLLASVLQLGFKNLVYCLPGEAFRLPSPGLYDSDYPFAETDAGRRAMDYSQTLIRLNKSIRRFRVLTHAVHPPLGDDLEVQADVDGWLDSFIFKQVEEPQIDTQTGDISNPINQEKLRKLFLDLIDGKPSAQLVRHEIFYYTEAQLLEIMLANDAQLFYQYHGFDKLASQFKLNKVLYEVNLKDNTVQKKEGAIRDFNVWMSRGQVWARTKNDGSKSIGNFTIECNVTVKGKKPLNLYEIRNTQKTVSRPLIMSGSQFRNPDLFRDALDNVLGAKFFYTGTKQNLLELQEVVHKEASEAISLEGELGLKTLDDGENIYVQGNGIISSDGTYYPANEMGLVTYKEVDYFLPADSLILKLSNSSLDYSTEKNFKYVSGDISLENWLELFLEVFGDRGHVAFSFVFASLFFDFITEKTHCFPHLFLQGAPGSGKTKCFVALSSLFGKLAPCNLESSRVTPPAYGAKFSQFKNGLNYFNEFNIQNIQSWMLLGMKAPYDLELGARMGKDWQSGRIDNGVVSSASILVGQNPVYLLESLNERMVIDTFTSEDYTDAQIKKFNYLMEDISPNGLGHLLANLLTYRSAIEEGFQTKYHELQAHFKAQTNLSKKGERLITNWAMIIAPLLVAIENGLPYPIPAHKIISGAIKHLVTHDEAMAEKGIMEVFWEFVGANWNERLYQLTDNCVCYDPKNNVVNVNLTATLGKFRSYLRANYSSLENTSTMELTYKLKTYPAVLNPDKKGVGQVVRGCWLGYERDETGRLVRSIKGYSPGGDAIYKYKKKRSSALQFDASRLNLELENLLFHFDKSELSLETNQAGNPMTDLVKTE